MYVRMETVKAQKDVLMEARIVFVDAGIEDRFPLMDIVPGSFVEFPGALFHQDDAVYLVKVIKGKVRSKLRLCGHILAHDDVGDIAVRPGKGKAVTDLLHLDVGKGLIIQLYQHIHHHKAGTFCKLGALPWHDTNNL